MVEFKEHIQEELRMQVVASKSPLSWALGRSIEADPEYEKSTIGINRDEVRKWEKWVFFL